jgi:hypothetical protein
MPKSGKESRLATGGARNPLTETNRSMSAINKDVYLARAVLQTVNRTQARGSTVQIVVPRDSDVTAELGIDLDEDRLQTAVEHLLERGYVVPADVGLTRGATPSRL